MMLTNEAISLIYKTPITVVDIGDSSGTHIQYIKNIHNNTRCLSVNLDETAVNKIKAKGLEAIFSRAEELFKHSINADVFLSFEMLEHLTDPIKFLHQLSEKTSCQYFVATVPYVSTSRVALNHIRQNIKNSRSAENTHIFEFSPDDWKLIFRHSGWDIVSEAIYFQYPKKNILWFTKHLWRLKDFEGFYGVILKRDNTWSNLYKDW
jgi:2-polyprenyl-3-methyl-5-hydroxy-6-metoxy-1,4-benzoquinol methylase